MKDILNSLELKLITKWIYLIDSWKKGNTTTIMVWVHGNEISWIDSLDEIIDDINIISGKVYFIYANLNAIKQNVRFTEKNLNRCFLKWNKWETYEDKRSQEIMNILDKTDYLLDVHNTESFNSSLEFLITIHTDYAKYFWVDKIVSHIDDIQKWWSEWYVDNIWNKWFCLECGSFNFWDKQRSKILAKESILNFLKVTKNIIWKPNVFNDKKQIVKMDYMYITKTDNFKLTKSFVDFEELNFWDSIALDWNEELKVSQDSVIIFAHNRDKKWVEWFCMWHNI